MKKIHKIAEIILLEDNESLVRYNGFVAYVRSYKDDGYRFHIAPFLSEWFDSLDKCNIAAIDHLFSISNPLTLLQDYISLIITVPWHYTPSADKLTIITPSGCVAVVNNSLKVIHATDADIQCSIYGFIECLKPYLTTKIA